MKLAKRLNGRDSLVVGTKLVEETFPVPVSTEDGEVIEYVTEDREVRVMFRAKPWRPSSVAPQVTRRKLIRAFSTPDRTRAEVLSLLTEYMGNSPVPPAWGRLGVRGIFGRKVERLWARHIHGLRPAAYRDPESGRWLHPVTQTAYDFGSTPEELRKAAGAANADNPDAVGRIVMSDLKAMVQSAHAMGNEAAKSIPIIIDEWSCYAALPSAMPMRSSI